MTRMTRLALAGAWVCLVASLTIQAQEPAGRGAAPGRGRGQAMVLPDGPGKDVVESSCAGCHGLNVITGSSGFDRQGWRNLIDTMVKLPEPQMATSADQVPPSLPVEA